MECNAELNAVVTVHKKRVFFTNLFPINCIFRLFSFFREGVKKEQVNSTIDLMICCFMFMIMTEALGVGIGKGGGRQKNN